MSPEPALKTTAEPVEPGLGYLTLQAALDRFGQPPSQLDPAQAAQAAKQAKAAALLQAKILAAPEAKGISTDASALDRAVAELKERFPEPDLFAATLEREGLDMSELRGGLARQLMVDAVLDKAVAGKVQVTPHEVESYYERHPEQFQRPATWAVRHILITVNPEFAENTLEAATARIEQVGSRVGRSLGKFRQEAARQSECPSALQEGWLGRIPSGTLYPELDAVLTTMGSGDIRGPIATEVGLHLLACDEAFPAGEVPLSEAGPVIREKLVERRRQALIRAWVAGLG